MLKKNPPQARPENKQAARQPQTVKHTTTPARHARRSAGAKARRARSLEAAIDKEFGGVINLLVATLLNDADQERFGARCEASETTPGVAVSAAIVSWLDAASDTGQSDKPGVMIPEPVTLGEVALSIETQERLNALLELLLQQSEREQLLSLSAELGVSAVDQVRGAILSWLAYARFTKGERSQVWPELAPWKEWLSKAPGVIDPDAYHMQQKRERAGLATPEAARLVIGLLNEYRHRAFDGVEERMIGLYDLLLNNPAFEVEAANLQGILFGFSNLESSEMHKRAKERGVLR